MSGEKDLQKLVENIQEIHEDLHENEKSLDETMLSCASAISFYRQFGGVFQSHTFDVKMLDKTATGTFKEVSFDWKALE